jgi:hypothetical protein
MIPRQRATISPSASSHDTGAKRPSPLAPTRRSGAQHALGRVDQLVLAIHLRAGKPLRHRMIGIALELRRRRPRRGDERALIGQSCAQAVRMVWITL